MGQHRGDVCLEPEAVGEEEVDAFLAKFSPEVAIAIQNLPYHRLRRRNIGIAFVDRRTADEPSSLGYIFLQSFIFLRVILLHQFVPAGTGECEYIGFVFFKPLKVIVQRVFQVFVYRCLVIPAPFGVEVCIPDGVQNRFFGKIVFRRCRFCWFRLGCCNLPGKE